MTLYVGPNIPNDQHEVWRWAFAQAFVSYLMTRDYETSERLEVASPVVLHSAKAFAKQMADLALVAFIARDL